MVGHGDRAGGHGGVDGEGRAGSGPGWLMVRVEDMGGGRTGRGGRQWVVGAGDIKKTGGMEKGQRNGVGACTGGGRGRAGGVEEHWEDGAGMAWRDLGKGGRERIGREGRVAEVHVEHEVGEQGENRAGGQGSRGACRAWGEGGRGKAGCEHIVGTEFGEGRGGGRRSREKAEGME